MGKGIWNERLPCFAGPLFPAPDRRAKKRANTTILRPFYGIISASGYYTQILKALFSPLAGQPKKGPYQFGAGAKHYTEKGASLAGFSNI